MKYLDYIKKYHNIDLVAVLMDELGYSDDEITTKLEISKQSIYNARARFTSLMKVIDGIEEYAPSYGNPEINKVVEAFKASFGTTKTTCFDRYAAQRLANKHGADMVVKIIQALSQLAGDKYMPSINSVQQLEEKWVSVGQFLNKQSNNIMVEL